MHKNRAPGDGYACILGSRCTWYLAMNGGDNLGRELRRTTMAGGASIAA